MRILVTGHRGYIGSVLSCVLRHARFDVTGLDCNLYHGCEFGRVDESIPSFDSDIRDIQFSDLVSFDAIVHLAALSEPYHDGEDTGQVAALNHEMTVELANKAKQAGVSRFVFASSNAVYGESSMKVFDEDDTPRPRSSNAISKLSSEHALMNMADETFGPVILRIGEVYGVSPRLRLDQVVNDMVGSAVATGRISMNYGLRGWRSLIHVEDLSRAIAGILKSSPGLVHGEVFNLTCPNEHFRLVEIADEIMSAMPMVTRSVAADSPSNPGLRTNGSKLTRTFTEFKYRWDLALGIKQLQSAFSNSGMAPGECRSDRYRRSMRLQTLVSACAVDETFRQTPRD